MKKLTFLLSVCLFLTCLTGCTSTQSSTAEPINISATSVEVGPSKSDAPVVSINKENLLPGLKKIVEKGTLTVAMINDEIPVFCETQSDGSVAGIDVNLAQELANSLGVTLTINRESNTYDELTDLLVKGAVDLVISTYSLTTERAACVSISNPYLTTRIGVMVNKQELVKNRIEKNPIDYMKSNNIKLAAIRHSAHVSMLPEMFPQAQVVEMDSYEEMYNAVRNGEIFGYVCGEMRLLCDYYEDETLPLYTQVFAFSDAPDNYCVGVAPDNMDLLSFVNSYLESSKTITVKDFEKKLKEKSAAAKE